MAIDGQTQMVALENTPHFRGFIEIMMQLKEEKLVEFSTSSTGQELLGNAGRYATILVDFGLMTDTLEHRMDSPELPDLSGFVVYVPTQDRLMHYSREQARYLVMSRGTDPGEVFHLLETMAQDEDVYRAIILGEQGVDYAMEKEGVYDFLSPEVDYARWRFTDAFRSAPREAGLRYSRLPVNFSQALEGLVPVYTQELFALQSRLGDVIWQEDFEAPGAVAMRERAQKMRDVMRALEQDSPFDWMLEDWPDITQILEEING